MSGEGRRYLLVSPCRNEAEFLKRTLDSVVNQSLQPARWVIVDDGSTDQTPQILADYAQRYDFIQVIQKPDRGARSVGPGVIEAFYFGYDQAEPERFDYVCKFDVDLDLPLTYFERVVERMEANPRLGTFSGKPYYPAPENSERSFDGPLISEACGDEMSVGMIKFYRRACFEEIGGFVREVMWDAIDCHKSRQLGWIACSWDDEELRFEHLRPMGTSQKGVFTGRMRHGFGQYYMGSNFLFFTATCIFRMAHPPYLLGGLATWWGYVKAWIQRAPQHGVAELSAFIRAYQRRALVVGKGRATAEIVARQTPVWEARLARAGLAREGAAS